MDGEGAWVIKGGIRGPEAQRAVSRGTGAKIVHLLPVHEAESMCPSRRDTGPAACQKAPGGGMEDRQRKTSWIRTVGNSLELTDSGPWKGTRALAGNHLQARRLSASLYPARAGHRLTLGRDLLPLPSSWDCVCIVDPLWASVS